MAPNDDQATAPAVGTAMAAILAAGIGAFAMGLFVILNEAGVFAAPSLYGPSGGVSGRTTFAAIAWLIAWVVLHNRWKGQQVESGRVFTLTLVLVGLGVLFCLPPLWGLL